MARFKEQDLKDVLFARAFEPDRDARIGLSVADAERANQEARAELAREGGEADELGFLIRRSRILRRRFEESQERLAAWRAAATWKGPPTWVVLVISFVIGLGVDRLGPSGNINLLSFPILGLLLWNVGIYLFMVLAPLLARGTAQGAEGQKSRRGTSGPVASALLWLASPLRFWRAAASRADHGDLAVNAQRYLRDWLRVGAPLHLLRAKVSMHLAAFGVMAGAVGGMYLRGLVLQYEATWGSTFLSAEAVHGLLHFLFAPVEGFLGEDLPDVATIDSLREPHGSGPAALWIHAWALTALWLVMIPRLALGFITQVRAASLARGVELDLDSDAYFLRLLAADRGQGTKANVQAYSYQPNARASEGLTTLLLDLFGGRTRVERLQPKEYGDLPIVPAAAGQDLCQVVLFSLSQSAEIEVHGKFLRETLRLLRECGGRASLLVVLDEGPFMDRLGNDEEGRARLSERQRSWKRVLSDSGVQALSCRLDGWSEPEILERAQNALLPVNGLGKPSDLDNRVADER